MILWILISNMMLSRSIVLLLLVVASSWSQPVCNPHKDKEDIFNFLNATKHALEDVMLNYETGCSALSDQLAENKTALISELAADLCNETEIRLKHTEMENENLRRMYAEVNQTLESSLKELSHVIQSNTIKSQYFENYIDDLKKRHANETSELKNEIMMLNTTLEKRIKEHDLSEVQASLNASEVALMKSVNELSATSELVDNLTNQQQLEATTFNSTSNSTVEISRFFSIEESFSESEERF